MSTTAARSNKSIQQFWPSTAEHNSTWYTVGASGLCACDAKKMRVYFATKGTSFTVLTVSSLLFPPH